MVAFYFTCALPIGYEITRQATPVVERCAHVKCLHSSHMHRGCADCDSVVLLEHTHQCMGTKPTIPGLHTMIELCHFSTFICCPTRTYMYISAIATHQAKMLEAKRYVKETCQAESGPVTLVGYRHRDPLCGPHDPITLLEPELERLRREI